jgi:hypothetical protein
MQWRDKASTSEAKFAEAQTTSDDVVHQVGLLL